MPLALHRSLPRFALFCYLCLITAFSHGQRFAAIGDYGYAGKPEKDVADMVKGWEPDFIITLGDNNYDVGDSSTIDQNIGQYYHNYIYKYRGRYGPSASFNRFFPSLGNHDYYTRNGEPYRDYFTLPGNGRYYDFVRGDVHFFAINSDPAEPDGINAASVQAQWLRKKLAASTSPWKIVYFHHAPYSSGAHGNTQVMQWPFQEWGASAVLAGHDHHYERLLMDGFPYFVNGLGGRSIYPLRRQPSAASKAIFNGDFGAMLMNANLDSITFQFFTRKQVLADTYVLHRTISSEPKLYPVYPNPFVEETTIEFSVPSSMVVQLRILNTLGQEVTSLQQGAVNAGWHRIIWQRKALKSGLYYVQLTGKDFSQVMRVVVL